MSIAHFVQSQKYGLSPARRLHLLVAAVGLARAVSTQATGIYFQNSYGLISPSNLLTFSESSPPPNTMITTQYQPYGITFVPQVQYASIYNQTSGTPHIDPAACVANFVQYGPVVPTFSIVFDRPVSVAAFAVLTQPGTFQVTALWAGIEVLGGPHTFTGGMGPSATNNFIGLSGVTFDELRISNVLTSDGALVVDNLQFTPALVNSWTNPASGRWDAAANWSFHTLPASNQTVSIANGGYKAVNIDNATFANFPASVTVSNLLVGAPTNALSTLLLNYAGLSTPLKVLNNCSIGPNGTIANFSSSFEVDGNAGGQLLVDGGTFTQEGGLSVINAPVFVRNGNLTATNANLTLGQLTVGSGTGSPDPYTPDAVFTQDGGSIAAQGIDIEQGGIYHLISGVLYGINGTTASGGPFWQYGGTNYGNITTLNYYYWLRGGMAQGDVLTAANDGSFAQDGGLLDMQFINVTGTTNWPASGGPWLSGGTVHCGTLNIGGNGKVELRGADVFVTNKFDLHGREFVVGDQGPLIEHADGAMYAGHLYLPSMSLGAYASFFQDGGSNEISGGLSMVGGQYSMYAGTLETTYTGVGAAATFVHGGGQHFVHGVLSITGTYGLSGVSQSGGCILVCEGLYLRGAMTMTLTDSGRGFNPSATITNTGLLNLGGTISTELHYAELGQVQLATNALIDLSARFPAVIHFQNSSAVSWTPGALMIITNWSSSDHLYAGSDASGLTASQLHQVEFTDPAGFAAGNYPAQLLSTGELVPAPRPTLQAVRIGSGLVLAWPSGFQLLSATNLNGPYTPVSGATSPRTNSFSKPREFFKLQSL